MTDDYLNEAITLKEKIRSAETLLAKCRKLINFRKEHGDCWQYVGDIGRLDEKTKKSILLHAFGQLDLLIRKEETRLIELKTELKGL